MRKVKQWFTRPRTANILMASFIIMTTTGAFIFSIPVGFVVAGVCCGAVGLLLGLD